MNVTLSVLNIAALVALVTFHFHDDRTQADSAAIQPQPHHLISQAPQLAIMNHQRQQSAILANESDLQSVGSHGAPRWIF